MCLNLNNNHFTELLESKLYGKMCSFVSVYFHSAVLYRLYIQEELVDSHSVFTFGLDYAKTIIFTTIKYRDNLVQYIFSNIFIYINIFRPTHCYLVRKKNIDVI